MKTKKALLISACLLGEPCRFDGQGKRREALLESLKGEELIPFCPEVSGGLPTPRPPSEISGECVFRVDGMDVTRYFKKGAQQGVETAKEAGATSAILKSRSPACGCGEVYDGSFTKTLVAGDGIFTQSLKTAGIHCISDEQYLQDSKDLS